MACTVSHFLQIVSQSWGHWCRHTFFLPTKQCFQWCWNWVVSFTNKPDFYNYQ